MAIFGKWGYKRLGGKKGLTLIELLIVLVILAILAGVIVLAVGGIFGRTGEQAYNLVRDELQLATTSYLTNASHDIPCVTGTTNATTGYCTIAVCDLIGMEELLREVPDGMRSANCQTVNATACAGACSDANSYLWQLDANGNVKSSCLDGAECTAAGDGYQGVWP